MIRSLRSSFINCLISTPRSRTFYSLRHKRLSDITHKHQQRQQQAIRIFPEPNSDSRGILQQAFIIRRYSAASESTAVVSSPIEPVLVVEDETKKGVEMLPIEIPKPPDPRKSEERYSAVIYYAARKGNMDTVKGLLISMRQRQFKPSIQAFTSIIHHYAKKSDMKTALHYYRVMRSMNIKPDAYIYTILIDGYLRVSNVERSERFCKKMLLQDLSPSVATWNVLIYNSTIQLDMKTANMFFEGMIETGLKPDIYTFSIMINGCKLHNDIEGAWRFYSTMIDSGVAQNEIAANILMHLYLQRHENEQIKSLFVSFFGDELKPDLQLRLLSPNKPQMLPHKSSLKTNTILLNALLGPADHTFISRLYEKFHLTVKKMLDSNNDGIAEIADVYTFTSFMRAFIRRHDHDSVLRILRDMDAHGIKPTLTTYNILILSYAFSAKMNRAMDVLKHMINHAGFKPDVATYTIMMRGWVATRNFACARDCYKDMVAAGITPNLHTMKVIQWMRWLEKGSKG